MRRLGWIATMTAMTLLEAGCGHIFEVQKAASPANASAPELDGIPFYNKVGKCLHTSVSMTTYYRITLTAGDAPSSTISVSEAAFMDKQVQELLEKLKATNDLQWWGKLSEYNRAPLQALCAIGEEPCAPWAGVTVSNAGVPVTLTDYSQLYTLNAKKPFSGTVNANYKLGADGTLSEASASVQDKTFETVAGLIPAAASAAAAYRAVPAAPSLKLAYEKRTLKVTRSVTERFTVGCPVTTIVDAKTSGASFTIEDISANADSPAKVDDNTVKVTGTITLPKPAAPKP